MYFPVGSMLGMAAEAVLGFRAGARVGRLARL